MDLLHLLGGKLLWAGDESSLHSLVASLFPENFRLAMESAGIDRIAHERRVEARRQSAEARRNTLQATASKLAEGGLKLTYGEDEEEGEDDYEAEEERYWAHSATYKLIGDTAIIGIRGNLVNSDKWYLRYMGAVGYPHIVDQLERGMNDKRVKAIILEINSPGGAVNGISQVSDAIEAVMSVKPVTSYSDGMIASAAYWFGCSCAHMTITNLTEAGSIGVVMTHMEYSKMMEKEGITPTVIRKGEFKMLSSPYEPLSDKARAEIDHSLNHLYDAFTWHVAVSRDVSQDTVKAKMAEGRVFWGQDAVNVGLVDKVGDLGVALAISQSLVQTSPATTY